MTRYRTIVADPPWPHPDTGGRTQSTAGNWRGKWLGYEGFLDVVEQVSPGPYLEIFARRARFGWDYAGDGSLGTVSIPGLREPGERAA